MKMKIGASAMLFVAGISVATSKAAIVFNDNFDTYTVNSALVGQGGWLQTGGTTTNPIQVVAGTTSQVAGLVTTGQDAYSAFTAAIPHVTGNMLQTDETINVSAAQATGDYFSHLTDVVGGSSVFLQRLFVKSTTGGYLLGLEPTAGGGAVAIYGTTVLPLSTDESIDIIWNFNAGTTADTFAVSVNGVPYAGLTSVPWGSTLAEPVSLLAANLRQGTAASAPTVTVDNYEVQGTPAVPEPTSLGLLVAAGGMMLGRRSRRA